MTDNFVLIIAGPPATGKTTLSIKVSEKYGCVNISEDEIAKRLFPALYTEIENYPDKLEQVKMELFKEIKKIFKNGKPLVIDCINLEREEIYKLKIEFGASLVFRVLLPEINVTLDRDKYRKNWISGEDSVKKYYEKYNQLKSIIGEDSYIDNTNQTPEETYEKYSYYSVFVASAIIPLRQKVLRG